MTQHADIPTARPARSGLRIGIGAVALIALLAAMALDTTVVRDGSDLDLQAQGFSPEAYGAETFPVIQASVQERAVEAPTLAEAIATDKAAAGEEYGVPGGIGPVFPVSFTGTVLEGSAGIYAVAVDGVPDDVTIRVQTGPAINGTDLRDSTGEITFGQFTNQIEYQDAGAAINDAMKEQVLAPLDTSDLTGSTIAVTGVFKMINPANWLVTPVEMAVQ
ncbi:DUF2291 family protein [Pseudoroseicyclus aestuarii]|uniref:Putative lipoprotein n=1 Tax=Pseudoroseicyclus aestuarii TaxID=1795041 RepID=A0A318SWR2_9RHOB|nr:DUF2291 domain-containing protein [Pseudoroseicyclus aestuarii]PYE84839.1 putative lipoprotein [Pseudoroseicyclus aestuarii]